MSGIVIKGSIDERLLQELMVHAGGAHGGISADDNPFVRDATGLYLRFDAIDITATPGGTNVGYIWKGMLCVQMQNTYPAVRGQTLQINGIEGRMRITLEAH